MVKKSWCNSKILSVLEKPPIKIYSRFVGCNEQRYATFHWPSNETKIVVHGNYINQNNHSKSANDQLNHK